MGIQRSFSHDRAKTPSQRQERGSWRKPEKEGATGLRGMTMAFWNSQYVYVWREYTKMWPVWNGGLGGWRTILKAAEDFWGWIGDGMSKRGVGRATILCMLSFHLISIIIRIIKKKVLAVQSCSQAAEQSECDGEPATLNFLFLYVFFTFSLSFYLSSAPFYLPQAGELKSNSPSVACPSSTEGRPGSRRRWSTSSRPSGCLAPAWGMRGHLSPFESGHHYWPLHVWRPDPRRRRRSLASHCASGSPVTWKHFD